MDVVLLAVTRHLPGKTKENHEKDWIRMKGDTAEIRTQGPAQCEPGALLVDHPRSM
jgi:hypothetical protein